MNVVEEFKKYTAEEWRILYYIYSVLMPAGLLDSMVKPKVTNKNNESI